MDNNWKTLTENEKIKVQEIPTSANLREVCKKVLPEKIQRNIRVNVLDFNGNWHYRTTYEPKQEEILEDIAQISKYDGVLLIHIAFIDFPEMPDEILVISD